MERQTSDLEAVRGGTRGVSGGEQRRCRSPRRAVGPLRSEEVAQQWGWFTCKHTRRRPTSSENRGKKKKSEKKHKHRRYGVREGGDGARPATRLSIYDLKRKRHWHKTICGAGWNLNQMRINIKKRRAPKFECARQPSGGTSRSQIHSPSELAIGRRQVNGRCVLLPWRRRNTGEKEPLPYNLRFLDCLATSLSYRPVFLLNLFPPLQRRLLRPAPEPWPTSRAPPPHAAPPPPPLQRTPPRRPLPRPSRPSTANSHSARRVPALGCTRNDTVSRWMPITPSCPTMPRHSCTRAWGGGGETRSKSA
jgi:hypothetical protein